MKEDKKKILTVAAFLIAAGLVFGMTRSRSGIQKLDESGAVVMSGSLDADGNISWEKNGSAKSDGLPQGDSGSSTEKQELQEPFRDENGSVQGESTVETQEYVENSEKSGVYVYICGEVAAPGVYELSEDSRIYEAVDAAGGFTENAARERNKLSSTRTLCTLWLKSLPVSLNKSRLKNLSPAWPNGVWPISCPSEIASIKSRLSPSTAPILRAMRDTSCT